MPAVVIADKAADRKVDASERDETFAVIGTYCISLHTQSTTFNRSADFDFAEKNLCNRTSHQKMLEFNYKETRQGNSNDLEVLRENNVVFSL